MNESLLYLDSSSIVKLILPEPETAALFRLMSDWPVRVTSALSRVEVLRAVQRADEDEKVCQRAGEVLDRLGIIRIDHEVLKVAARLGPKELRSLDAIHLSTALTLGNQLGGFSTYDIRLGEAAKATGVRVLQPK